MATAQTYPSNPGRFEGHFHKWVLCSESLPGRCYWEAEWEEWAELLVAYKGIRRKENTATDSSSNRKSWHLSCSKYGYSLSHERESFEIRTPASRRVAVYLDWPAGSLSFFSVHKKHKLSHIHTFHGTFTEPLYAGFGVYNLSDGEFISSVTICRMDEADESQ